MMTIVEGGPMLIGESNPYSDDPEHALLPWPPQSAGARLCRLLGWTDREYLATFKRGNLLHTERWSVPRARAAAADLVESHDGDFVMLGARVADAFRKNDLGLFIRDGRFVRLPHPSGLSRAWNDEGSESKLRAVLEEYRCRA